MFSTFSTFLRHEDAENVCLKWWQMYFIRKSFVHLNPTVEKHQTIKFQNSFEKRISRCSSTFCLHPLLGKTASTGQVSKLFQETNFKVLQHFLPGSCSRESWVLTNWFFLLTPTFCKKFLRNCALKNNDWFSEDGKLSPKWGQWIPEFQSFCIRWGSFLPEVHFQMSFSLCRLHSSPNNPQLWIIGADISTEKSRNAIASRFTSQKFAQIRWAGECGWVTNGGAWDDRIYGLISSTWLGLTDFTWFGFYDQNILIGVLISCLVHCSRWRGNAPHKKLYQVIFKETKESYWKPK